MLACVAAPGYALPMPLIKTAIDTNSQPFQANAQVNRALAAQLRDHAAKAAQGVFRVTRNFQ